MNIEIYPSCFCLNFNAHWFRKNDYKPDYKNDYNSLLVKFYFKPTVRWKFTSGKIIQVEIVINWKKMHTSNLHKFIAIHKKKHGEQFIGTKVKKFWKSRHQNRPKFLMKILILKMADFRHRDLNKICYTLSIIVWCFLCRQNTEVQKYFGRCEFVKTNDPRSPIGCKGVARNVQTAAAINSPRSKRQAIGAVIISTRNQNGDSFHKAAIWDILRTSEIIL